MARAKKVIVKGAYGDMVLSFAGQLTPDRVAKWQPWGAVTAVIADGIRHRVSVQGQYPSGAQGGPHKITGAMWSGWTAKINAKGRSTVTFLGSSLPAWGGSEKAKYYNASGKKSAYKVPNRTKAARILARASESFHAPSQTEIDAVVSALGNDLIRLCAEDATFAPPKRKGSPGTWTRLSNLLGQK